MEEENKHSKTDLTMKEIGKRINHMERGNSWKPMEVIMKALLKMNKVMGKESTSQEMENSYMKGSSGVICSMDSAPKQKLANMCILATLKIGQKMGKGRWSGMMVEHMMGYGKMGSFMV